MSLCRVSLADLLVEDEASFRHVGLYAELKAVVRDLGPTFLVPPEGKTLAWDRALLLNLLYWQPGTSDVLPSRVIAADVVMHVAWHELANRFVAPSVEGHLLGESIASAFDLYLVGRLLGHSPESDFLETQVARMSEAASDAGVEQDELEALLARASENPERAFEHLRQLLFDVSCALCSVESAERGLQILASFDDHPYAGLLHHFELPTWVLRAKLEAQAAPAQDRPDALRDARAVDQDLRASGDSVAWLEQAWVRR